MVLDPHPAILTVHAVDVYGDLTKYRSGDLFLDRLFFGTAAAVAFAFHVLDAGPDRRNQYQHENYYD